MDEIRERRIIKTSNKNWFKERMSRFRPIVFLKKNLPILVFLLLLVISILAGLWNIRKFEILQEDGGEVDGKVHKIVEDYLKKEIKGRNFFSIHSSKLAKELADEISYVQFATVSKNVPNSLVVVLKTFPPKIVAYTKDSRCTLLSVDGVVLENLCEQEEDISACCIDFHSKGSYYLFQSNDVDIAKLDSGGEKLLVMETISKIIKIVRSFEIDIKEVSLKENIVEIKDDKERIARFTLSGDIEEQLARYFVVMGKVRSESMEYKEVDARFNRPVVKN